MPRHLPKPPWPNWVGNGSTDDSNYPAGGNPYNGTPRIVPPTEAEQAAGLVPSKATIGAQQHNWLFSRFGGLIEPLVHNVMRSWRGFVTQESLVSVGDAGMGAYDQIDNATSEPATSYTLAGPFYTSRFYTAMMMIVGSDGSNMQRRYGSDGHHWHDASDVGLADGDMEFESFEGVSAYDPNHGYTIYASSADDDIWVSHDTSLTPTEITNVAPSGFGIGCVKQGSSGFILGVAGGGATTSRIITTYPDAPADGTFTTRTVPASWNTTTIHNIVTNGKAGIGGTSEIMVATGNRAASEVLYSQDSGQTWDVATMPFSRSGFDAYQIAYSPVHDLFLAVNSDLRMMVSSDGANWNAIQTTDLNGIIVSDPDRGRLLAASGPCFAMAVNRNSEGGHVTRRGVMYTFNLENWYFVDFGVARRNTDVVDKELRGIREWRGGFLVWAPGQGWVSQSLYVPDPEMFVPG